MLVLFDGLELYEPFHLKDYGGVVSVIDVEAIGGIDMVTGAFSAEYGDKLSGVFNIKSASPTYGVSRTSIGLSFMNARFLSEGSFGDGRGQWMVLARRGYLDVVLALVGEDDDLSPKYYDVISKLQYQLNEEHILAAHYVLANDDLHFHDDEDGDDVRTSYGNTYGWLTLNSSFTDKLFAQTILSYGHIDQNRIGTDFDRGGRIDAQASDVRDFSFLGIKQNWDYSVSDSYILKLGYDLKGVWADYDYFNRDTKFLVDDGDNLTAAYDTTIADLNPNGSEIGLFLSNKMRPLNHVTAELGIRYDRASWSSEHNISPRVNVAVDLASNTTLRLGWGYFYQSHGINDLDVQDNDTRFYPAERAEHRVLGLEHRFQSGMDMRIEAYHKKLSDVRPRYLNLSNELEAFPEVEQDRIRIDPEDGVSKGLEIFFKQDSGGKINWWASYGYAIAEDKVDGLTVPRNLDQRHTVYLDLGYKPNQPWRLNLTWQYHSGWPYTLNTLERVDLANGDFYFADNYGPVNAERFPAYHRMDVRVSRYFNLPKGRLSTFLEFRNLYGRDNIRLYDPEVQFRGDGSYVISRREDTWLPMLPSMGISWDF